MEETTRLQEELLTINEARLLGSQSQKELADAAEKPNTRPLAEIAERGQTEEALRHSERFARSRWAEAEAALEAVPANIAILDAEGVIVRVNQAWCAFSSENGGDPAATDTGVSYLKVCDSAAGDEAGPARDFADGIRSVISGERHTFSMEYPCHSPTEQRWFMGYVTASRGAESARAVVAHVDVTALKRSEEQTRILNRELEARVSARTSELQLSVRALERVIAERQRLEREILEISEREQCRIGQDLHDGLGQELAGIAMFAEVVAQQLRNESHPRADDAGDIAKHIRGLIQSARRLAKGLYPVELTRGGLILALQDLANRTSQLAGIACELRQSGSGPVLPKSSEIHIYRIVQECINNAIKHGRADRIIIESKAGDGVYIFSVTDNGGGFEKPVGSDGMGLHLMDYRASVIGAEFDITRPTAGGCRVTCRLRV